MNNKITYNELKNLLTEETANPKVFLRRKFNTEFKDISKNNRYFNSKNDNVVYGYITLDDTTESDIEDMLERLIDFERNHYQTFKNGIFKHNIPEKNNHHVKVSRFYPHPRFGEDPTKKTLTAEFVLTLPIHRFSNHFFDK